MSIQDNIARWGGKVWLPRDLRGKPLTTLWPYPSILHGVPHYKLDSDDYRCFTTFIRPGDMLLTKGNEWIGSNANIKKTAFKHLAVYTGAVKAYRDETAGFLMKPVSLGLDHAHRGGSTKGVWERTVTHAISEGVMTQDLLEVMFHHMDYMCVVRPWKNSVQQKAIVDYALAANGLGYNFDFTPDGPKALYCTELGSKCCEAAGIVPPEKIPINISWKGFIPGLTKKYLYPVTLADYFVRSFPVVACTKSCSEPDFHSTSSIPEVLRLALKDATDFNTMTDVRLL